MFRNKFGQKVCMHGSSEMCRRRHKKQTQKMRMVSRERTMTLRKG